MAYEDLPKGTLLSIAAAKISQFKRWDTLHKSGDVSKFIWVIAGILCMYDNDIKKNLQILVRKLSQSVSTMIL